MGIIRDFSDHVAPSGDNGKVRHTCFFLSLWPTRTLPVHTQCELYSAGSRGGSHWLVFGLPGFLDTNMLASAHVGGLKHIPKYFVLHKNVNMKIKHGKFPFY